MPKNNKKKAGKKASVTSEDLSDLLLKAKEARPAAVRQYLKAGGQWDASVDVTKGAVAISVPLFHALLLNHHGQMEEMLQTVLSCCCVQGQQLMRSALTTEGDSALRWPGLQSATAACCHCRHC
jgi:hypothetical protein